MKNMGASASQTGPSPCGSSQQAVSPVPASVPCAERELLGKVLDYYQGRKPFDFYRLPADQRANEAFDAWQVIAGEIETMLGRKKLTRREKKARRAAQAIEARRAIDAEGGVVGDESAVP